MIKIFYSVLPLMLLLPMSLRSQLTDKFHPMDHDTLKISMYCRTCHVCNNPVKENPCYEPCPRHSGRFSGEHSIDEGTEIVILDQLVNIYGPVVFAHYLHASMTEMSGGCEICHHYSEIDAKVPSCRTCHEVGNMSGDLRQPSLKGAYHRQCLNCHREWNHDDSCDMCHVVMTDTTGLVSTIDKTDIVGVPHPLIEAEDKYVYNTHVEDGPIVTFHHADHVDLFGQQCVDCHKGDSCCRCHEAGHEHKEIEHTNTCCSCHQEEENCNFCHNDKEQPPFNHTVSTGWKLSKYHANNACQDCHGPVKSFVKPSTVCVNCHIHWEEGSFSHEITGLILDEDHEENECGDCHVDMDFSQTPNCTDCHDEIQYPDESPGELISD